MATSSHEPDIKRPRLERLGFTSSYVSQSALARILRVAEEDGIPAASSRATQYRARKATCETQTPYGKLIETVTIDGADIPVCNPLPVLHHTCEISPSFRELLTMKLDQRRPTQDRPWRMCFYQDGISPASPLLQDDDRKVFAFYWSFVEFGEYLSCEETWLSIGIETHVHA